MDYNKWIAEATNKTKQLHANTTFVLKDLFDGIKWNELAPGNKLSFGRRFKNKVDNGEIPNVICIGKAQNNSTLYQKTAVRNDTIQVL